MRAAHTEVQIGPHWRSCSWLLHQISTMAHRVWEKESDRGSERVYIYRREVNDFNEINIKNIFQIYAKSHILVSRGSDPEVITSSLYDDQKVIYVDILFISYYFWILHTRVCHSDIASWSSSPRQSTWSYDSRGGGVVVLVHQQFRKVLQLDMILLLSPENEILVWVKASRLQ